MDWILCLICQKETIEPLKCPLNSLNKEVGYNSYKSFLDILKALREINASTFESQLDEATTVEDLVQKKASWHKSCRLQFTQSKLERERLKLKRISSDNALDLEERKSKRQSAVLRNACMFCEAEGPNKLHQVLTLEVDNNVRKMATQLQDKRLIAKLSEGDLVATEAKYHANCMLAFRRMYNSFIKINSDEFNVTNEKEEEARNLQN